MSFSSRRTRRAVIYGRVSKLAPGVTHGRSVDSQIELGLAWANREGVTVVGVHRDDGASAYNTKAKRAGWREVMAALTLGEANELWAWEVARASRDRDVWTKLIRTCQANDTILTINDRSHDPNDPDDAFMLDLMAALAIRESAQTQKRILRDVRRLAEQGRPHGKLPWAYTREYDPKTGQLLKQVPNPDTAPVLREMARRYLGGESMYAIARDLNARGVPSPETLRQRRKHGPDHPPIDWRPGEVKEQLVSPTNAGLRTHNGEVVAQAAWDPILTAEEHAQLRAQLVRPGQTNWRDGGARHLLTGIATCGVCGAKIRAVKNRGYPSYACAGLTGNGSTCVARVEKPVDALVTYRAVLRLQDEQLVERLAQLQAESNRSAGEAVRSVVELKGRLRRFEESAASSLDPRAVESFARVVADISDQLRVAEAAVEAAGVVSPLLLSVAGPDAPERWAGLSVAQQRQIVRILFRVVIHKSSRKRGARGFDDSTIETIPLL